MDDVDKFYNRDKKSGMNETYNDNYESYKYDRNIDNDDSCMNE